MPFAVIESSRGPEEVAALMEAVYQARLEALQVSEDDRQIRYPAYPDGHFPFDRCFA